MPTTGQVSPLFSLAAVGIYYAVLALMRFSLLRSIRTADAQEEKKAYFRTAILLNVLTVTMTGIFAQLIIDDQVGKLADTPIKQLEYQYVSGIVLATRAIIRGGVSPEGAYELEESLLQQISTAQTRQQLEHIYILAMRSLTSD